MKQVIGIYCGKYENVDQWNFKTLNERGVGGSESWAIYLSNEFQQRGYHVIIFCDTPEWCFSDTGVEYMPSDMLSLRCTYQHFDYFITSRRVDCLGPHIHANKVYVMVHDMQLTDNGNLNFIKINKVSCLSDWHKTHLKKIYNNLNDNMIFMSANGVDTSLYEDADSIKKENAMIWSSAPRRGLDLFINRIMPNILKEVPDFKLYVSFYNDEADQYKDNPNVILLDKLNKKDLAFVQKRCKIWVYHVNIEFPFRETFCITAIENALAKNAIFASNIGGVATTLNGYEGLYGDELHLYNIDAMTKDAIHALTDESYRLKLVESAYDKAKKYTWSYVADIWEKEFRN